MSLKKFDVPLVFVAAIILVVIPVLALVGLGMQKVGLGTPLSYAS